MISKEEATKIFTEGIKTEESAIPLYVKHIENTLFLSGFDEVKKARIKEILLQLKQDSGKHKKTYEYLLNITDKSKQNVY